MIDEHTKLPSMSMHRARIHAGLLSSSKPNWSDHVFMKLALYTGMLKHQMTFPKLLLTQLSKRFFFYAVAETVPFTLKLSNVGSPQTFGLIV